MTVCQGPIDIFFNVTLLYVPVGTMALYVFKSLQSLQM